MLATEPVGIAWLGPTLLISGTRTDRGTDARPKPRRLRTKASSKALNASHRKDKTMLPIIPAHAERRDTSIGALQGLS